MSETSQRPTGPSERTPEPKATPRMSAQQKAFWRAANAAALAGDLIQALLLFEAGRHA